MHYLISINPYRGGKVKRVQRAHFYLFLLAISLTSSLSVYFHLRGDGANHAGNGAYHAMLSAIPNSNELKKYVAAHAQLREDIDRDRAQIDSIAKKSGQKVDAISMRLSALQGQIVRMEAIGKHIADMAGLKEDEFNLDDPVGLGGPESPENFSSSYSDAKLVEDIAMLESRMAGNIDKLMALESLLMDKQIQDQAVPAGTPVPGGWISSSYGMRNDPFTGKRAFHRGMDIAAKKGSKVLAVAPGMVVFSGYRTGYGNMVEIQHAEGFVTKYAHNSKNLVAVGTTVQKSQEIAIIGSTGRSTGLHVHFEVVKDSIPVNPRKFVLLK